VQHVAQTLLKEGIGVGFLTATAARPTSPKFLPELRMLGALSRSGFRRFATYRQATVASAATNTVFGFLRAYVLLAAASAANAPSAASAGGAASGGGGAGGYDRTQLALFVWLGQGLIGVVGFWGWTDLADRIRTGEVVVDLVRPLHPVAGYLAADLGRAAHAVLTRLLVPLAVGALFFDLYVPHRPGTYPLFAASVILAVLVSFAGRYLVNAAAFWLLDIRGLLAAWAVAGSVLSGLYFPMRFLPDWVAAVLWYATPFPSLLQTPIDIAVERTSYSGLLGLVAVQVGWAAALLALCVATQRRAERRLVIQGG
jgi:ABC-2 type transport system permease protein